jgi:hypothetical protein
MIQRRGTMVGTGRRVGVALKAAALVAFVSAPAMADATKDQCIDANGKGQELRREGKLSAAAEQFRRCSDAACPAMVRDDCTRRLDDVVRAQPTIAFQIKDASGSDLSTVTVTMDDKPLATRLDGSALPVDVGQHVFTFAVSGQAPVSLTLVLTEGEKGRLERVTVGGGSSLGAPASGATGAVGSTSSSAAAGGGLGKQKLAGLVVGGVGVAGIAVGTIFGLMTLSQKSNQQSACASATDCTDHDQAVSAHSSGMTDGTIATIGFVAGAALLAGGAVLFFTGHSPERQTATRIHLVPSVAPGSGGLSIDGAF